VNQYLVNQRWVNQRMLSQRLVSHCLAAMQAQLKSQQKYTSKIAQTKTKSQTKKLSLPSCDAQGQDAS
jgi:hypothetical protein